MKKSKKSAPLLQTNLAVVIAVLAIGGLVSPLCLADPKSDVSPAAADSPPSSTNAAPVQAESAQLSGAELYSIHCNRCHPERYPTERTAANWKTIMLHMRVRANLPAEQARQILKYLQDNSGR